MKKQNTTDILTTLVPEMAAGFVIRTPSGQFLLRQEYGLDDAIAQVRRVIAGRERAWAGRRRHSALTQLDSYLAIMRRSPAERHESQAAHLRGYLEALHDSDIIDYKGWVRYSAAIDRAAESDDSAGEAA